MADQYRKDSDMYRGNAERPWSNRAGDEARSWFGADDARQRRERDEERQNRENRQNRGWEGEGDWYRSGSSAGRSSSSRSSGWDNDWNRQDRGGYSGQGYGRERDGGQYGGSEYRSGSQGERGYGGQFYGADDYRDRQYRGGQYGSGLGGDYRTGSTGRNSSSFGDGTSQFDRGDQWRGGGSGAYTGGGSQPSYSWTQSDSLGSNMGRSETHFGKGPKGYQRSDERIREEISDQLTFDHQIDASELTVEVKDGEVTLSGSVRDREQKRRAEDLAERVMGVHDVTNNLRVTKSSEMNQGSGGWGSQGMSGSQGMTGSSGTSGSNPSGTMPGSTGRNKTTTP